MEVAYEFHRAGTLEETGEVREVREQDACWCALLRSLVREGAAITPELGARMSAAGLDLDRLHRSLQLGRRRATLRAG
jgi:hypothetical protein